MIYATVQDMVNRFGEREMIQISTGAGDDAVVNAAKVECALADAQAYLDGYVGTVYRLPLVGCIKPAPTPQDPAATELVAPPQLVRMACDAARYYLFDQVGPEHEACVRFKATQRDLEAIAAGRAVLSCPWGGQPGAPLTGTSPGEAEVFCGFSPRQISDSDGY